VPPVVPDRLDAIADADLHQMQLSLGIACGRSRSAFRDKHRTYICTLLQILQSEAKRRGKTPVGPPFTA
jgi:hypothetical protein